MKKYLILIGLLSFAVISCANSPLGFGEFSKSTGGNETKPNFLMTCFSYADVPSILKIETSSDGISFINKTINFSPVDPGPVGLRDPSIVLYQGVSYLVAYTRGGSTDAGIGFAHTTNLFNSTPSFSDDGFVIMSKSISFFQAFAPELYWNGGTLYMFFAATTPNPNIWCSINTGFPNFDDESDWSEPVSVGFPLQPNNSIDPFIYQSGVSFHLWFHYNGNGQIGLNSSLTITTNYFNEPVANTNMFNAIHSAEGECLVVDGSNYYLYYSDQNGDYTAGYWRRSQVTSEFVTYGAPITIFTDSLKDEHGTIIKP